jgi:hypothetical protein
MICFGLESGTEFVGKIGIDGRKGRMQGGVLGWCGWEGLADRVRLASCVRGGGESGGGLHHDVFNEAAGVALHILAACCCCLFRRDIMFLLSTMLSNDTFPISLQPSPPSQPPLLHS